MSFTLEDVHTIEEGGDSALDGCLALQRAINAGMWSLQGSYGRQMMAAIEAGDCLLGRNACRDYYGNRIPSRTEVEAGTKGSLEFVVAAHDEDWAKAMLEA